MNMAKIRKITVLSHDVSDGGLTRAYLLAQITQKLGIQAEVVGFRFGKKIFSQPPPDVKIMEFPGCNYPGFLKSAHRLMKAIRGDVVYAVKPRPTSFGVALRKRFFSRIPVILDMDDWEMSWYGGDSWKYHPEVRQLFNDIFKNKWGLLYPDHPLYIKRLEGKVWRADALTVDTFFLQNRFGGVYLPNGKDTDLFDPAKFNSEEERLRRGLNGYRVILFAGTARQHKGLEDVLTALDIINEADLRLVLAGENPYDDFDKTLLAKWGRWIINLPAEPTKKMPAVISCAHIFIVPSRDTMVSRAQLPIKLAEGMSMSKPIIATKVGDIPEILADTAYLVDPSSPEQIAHSIKYIFSHQEEAQAKAKAARNRCVKFYGLEAIAKILAKVFDSL